MYTNKNCDCCPVDWDSDYYIPCIDSYYGDWLTTDDTDYKKASELARKIADLPLKHDMNIKE